MDDAYRQVGIPLTKFPQLYLSPLITQLLY